MRTVTLHLWREQVLGKGRDDRPREEIRGQHGKDHRLGQRHEEIFRGAGEEKNRDKNDANAKRRDERRHRNLGRTIEDAFLHRPSLGHVAMDILNLDRRVVDQDSDRQGHPAKSHDIDRLP